MDGDGNALLAEPVELDRGTHLAGPSYPNVAWNGSLYLAAWGNADGVVARRLNPGGTLLDPAPIIVMGNSFGPSDLAAIGGNFLVTGRKFGYTPRSITVTAARVRGSDGVVLDASPIDLGGSFARPAAVAVLGGRWVVAWHSNVTHDDPIASTTGVFVSADGSRSNVFTINSSFSTAGGNGIFEVGLASSGSVALLVQSQEVSSGVETDLWARLVHADGSLGAPITLTPWDGNQYRPRVAWDGTNFVVAFQDQKTRTAAFSLEQLDARSDLFGMRVSTGGVPVDPQGFVFSALPVGETDPNVVALNGVSLIAGAVMDNASSVANYRVALRPVRGGRQPMAGGRRVGHADRRGRSSDRGLQLGRLDRPRRHDRLLPVGLRRRRHVDGAEPIPHLHGGRAVRGLALRDR